MHTCDSTDMTCLSLAEGAHNAQEIVLAHSSQFDYLDILPPSWLLVVSLHCFDVYLFVCFHSLQFYPADFHTIITFKTNLCHVSRFPNHLQSRKKITKLFDRLSVLPII